MEKKQNLRTNQLVSAKGLTTDSRKSNQEPSGKQLPRNLRRRDFTGNHNNNNSNSNNNNNNSNNNNISSSNAYGANNGRNQMQLHQQQHIFAPKSRGAGADKRQNRPRHDGYQRSVGATTSSNTGLDAYDARRCNDDGSEFEAELNSIYLPGSKKQNLNHLLNFNYAPRERHDSGTLMRTGNNAKGHGYVKHIKYNKEQFLQANCQFVVNASGNYAAHTSSPDLLVEWTCIEQINIGSTEEPQCPICLYHPVAAKMTRCGHVYCWPCILHYLALSDKKSWRKCPICYEAVHIGDLKSAVARPQRNYNCDDIVTLQLMCRSKDSLQVSKVGNVSTVNANTLFPCLSDGIASTVNSKLVLAKPLDIMSIIERERNELKCQLTSDGIDCPDSVFVQQALHLLEERQKLIGEEAIAAPMTTKIDVVEDEAKALAALTLNVDAKEFVPTFDDASSSTASDNGHFIIDEETNLTVDDIDIVPNTALATNSNNFYFYQSNDGQNLYLHSVNVRMLQAMYGSLEAAPKSINGRILQKEVCSMSEDLRKRLKYLQHLPVSCQFEVVEIQLDRSIISAEVFVKFKDELLMRQKTRERRAREERKREKHIDRVNERQIGMMIRSTVHIDVTSDQQFPMCGENFDDAPILVAELSTSMVGGSSSSITPVAASTGPSFAKMLTSPQSGTQGELWPTLAQPKEILATFSANDFLPLRPTRPSIIAQHTIVPHEHSEDESVDYGNDCCEEACAPPEFKSSFGAAIAEALNKSAHVKPTKNRSQVTNGRGKKKKNNGMVLFSTGGRTYDGN